MKRTTSVNALPKQISNHTKLKARIRTSQSLISSGSTLLNLALGGGYPIGKIINLVGDKSTGKTLLAAELIASAKYLYGKRLKWFYDDAETGFGFDTKKMYGFDMTPENEDIYSNTVEDFDRNLTEQLDQIEKDERLIYVLDSLDSLSSEAEIEREKKDSGKGTYGLEKQKMLGKFFRLKTKQIKDKNCLLVIISQVRQNIGVMFGEKYIRTGGKALDHYCSQIIWLAEVEKHKKKERAIGISIKAQIKKNKVGKPFREVFLDLLFDYGLDDITTNINYLFDLKDKRGKTKKESAIWHGQRFTPTALLKHIESNNQEENLRTEVIKKWNEVEEAISPKRKNKYETKDHSIIS